MAPGRSAQMVACAAWTAPQASFVGPLRGTLFHSCPAPPAGTVPSQRTQGGRQRTSLMACRSAHNARAASRVPAQPSPPNGAQLAASLLPEQHHAPFVQLARFATKVRRQRHSAFKAAGALPGLQFVPFARLAMTATPVGTPVRREPASWARIFSSWPKGRIF